MLGQGVDTCKWNRFTLLRVTDLLILFLVTVLNAILLTDLGRQRFMLLYSDFRDPITQNGQNFID